MRSNSLISALGVKKGDVIREVNGIQLTSMDKILQAYQRLKTQDELRFSISRRGRPVELDIQIR